MEILIFALVVLGHLITAFFTAIVAESKGVNFVKSFLVTLFLGVIIGFLYILVNVISDGRSIFDDKACECKSKK